MVFDFSSTISKKLKYFAEFPPLSSPFYRSAAQPVPPAPSHPVRSSQPATTDVTRRVTSRHVTPYCTVYKMYEGRGQSNPMAPSDPIQSDECGSGTKWEVACPTPLHKEDRSQIKLKSQVTTMTLTTRDGWIDLPIS